MRRRGLAALYFETGFFGALASFSTFMQLAVDDRADGTLGGHTQVTGSYKATPRQKVGA